MPRHWRDVEPWNREYLLLVAALVVVWGFADTASTLAAASLVGPHLELNPLVRGLLPDAGRVLAVKAGAALAVGLFAVAGERFVRTVPWWRTYLAALVGVGLGVTLLNTLVVVGSLYPALVP